MLVAVVEFGSVWRWRLPKGERDFRAFGQAVYYNTSGVHVGGAVRQRPQIAGYARFHAVSGFDPTHPARMIHRVFECADPDIWQGQNKLLFRRLLSAPQKPDAYLTVLRPELTGALTVGKPGWRSPDTWLLSFSEDRQRQEALLLMTGQSWVEAELGRFVLQVAEQKPWVARLVLTI